MVFCAQVMRKKLDKTFPEHDRKRILSTLGVDVNAMSSSIYNEELIKDRIKSFRENNKTMSKSVARVVKDANFELETTQHAT
jgi:fibrillarin-like rRNA methylase